MNNTIWKYNLEPTNVQVLYLPIAAEVLSVGNRDGDICLWVIVNPKEGVYENRTIEIFGTGPAYYIDEKPRKFIGTVIIDRYVWHIFEVLTTLK